MPLIHLNHEVKDFKVWKPFYDADQFRRQAAGLKEIFLATNADNPNEVHIIFETNDVNAAKKMMENPELREVQDKAGVIRRPSVTVLNTV